MAKASLDKKVLIVLVNHFIRATFFLEVILDSSKLVIDCFLIFIFTQAHLKIP